MKYIVKFTCSFLCLVFSGLSIAAAVNNLLVSGTGTSAGIVGTYSYTTWFSWMNHRFPGVVGGHSWTLGPGASGGILLGRPQNPGELTVERLMFNQPTSFYSVNNGITIDSSSTIDMSNLRMLQSSNVLDIGSGSGYPTNVPQVADINTLQPEENGWHLNPDNTYRLVYHTRGTCTDCKLTLHFTGTNLEANGDINEDGTVNAADLLLSHQGYTGSITLDAIQTLRADVAPVVNGQPKPDGVVNVSDLLVIQRLAQGLTSF